MKKSQILSEKASVHIDESDPKCILIWYGVEDGYISSVICGYIEPFEDEYRAVISKVLGVHLNCTVETKLKTPKGAKRWLLDTISDIFGDISQQFKNKKSSND